MLGLQFAMRCHAMRCDAMPWLCHGVSGFTLRHGPQDARSASCTSLRAYDNIPYCGSLRIRGERPPARTFIWRRTNEQTTLCFAAGQRPPTTGRLTDAAASESVKVAQRENHPQVGICPSKEGFGGSRGWAERPRSSAGNSIRIQDIRSFVRSFVRLFVRSFVRSKARSFVPKLVRSFVRPSARSFVRSFVTSSLRSFVTSFVRHFVRSSLRSFVTSSLRSVAAQCVCSVAAQFVCSVAARV